MSFQSITELPFFAPKNPVCKEQSSTISLISYFLIGFGVNSDDLNNYLDISGLPIQKITPSQTIAHQASQVGLTLKPIILPIDYITQTNHQPLPLIVFRPDITGKQSPLIIWNNLGPMTQVIDPAKGGTWKLKAEIWETLQPDQHRLTLTQWETMWAETTFKATLKTRLMALAGGTPAAEEVFEQLTDQVHWYTPVILDAALRMAAILVKSGGFQVGTEALNVIQELVKRTRAEPMGQHQVIPKQHWAIQVVVSPQGEETLIIEGVEGLEVIGYKPVEKKMNSQPTSAKSSSTSPEPDTTTQAAGQAKGTPPPTRPLKELRDFLGIQNFVTPAFLASALALSAAGVTLQGLLFRSFMGLSTRLSTWEMQVKAVGILLVFLFILLLLAWSGREIVSFLGREMEIRLRITVLGILPRLSFQYLQKYTMGDMTERIHTIQDLRELPIIGGTIIQLIAQFLLTAVGILWIDTLSATLAFVKIAIFLVVMFNAGGLLQAYYIEVRDYIGTLSRLYLDGLLGLIPIRTHGVERALRREYESLLIKWANSKLKLFTVQTWSRFIEQSLTELITVLILVLYVARGQEIANLPLLLYWIVSIDFLADEITFTIFWAMGEYSKGYRVMQIVNAPHEQDEMRHLFSDEENEPNNIEMDQVEQTKSVSIALNNLTVEVAGQVVLKDINLAIPAGSHIAVVGASGAGKSTLMGAIMGWYWPSSGQIQIDGQPLTHHRLKQLRHQTAWVDPALQLWNRSMLYNLRYGGGDMLLNEVIEQADLLSLLEHLPEGLQTRLGEGGKLVSGGEGQRVRFGRILQYQTARLVILDEAFRGLDREKRRTLLTRAKHLWPNTTLLCVTHDVGETQVFERIIVVEGGQIIEDGNPTKLATQPESRYKTLLEAEMTVRQKLWTGKDIPWRRLWLAEGKLREQETPEEVGSYE